MSAQYWGLSPEINAIRLTTGPGATAMAPVLAGYETAGITHLEQGTQMITTAATTAAASWQGHGGTSMLAAAVPKSEWQVEAAAHAAKAGALIGEAATAHASAVAATVPYPVVIQNRVREATLQAANVPAMGTLTPAIIETNVEYGEFWAQNASAMTTYATAGLGIITGLSVPLRPAMVTGNPAALAAGFASMGTGFAQTGLQGAAEALGAPVQVASQAAATAAPAALSATNPGTAKPGTTQQGDSAAATPPPPLAQPQGSELLSAGQSMLGTGPQALQGLTQPLSQVSSLPQQVGGQLTGMLSGMSSMGGGPGAGGLSASSPGSNLAASVSGLNGGYGSGGGPVSAALTRSSGVGGPVGLPSTWWGAASAPEGASTPGQSKPAAAARAAGPVAGSGAPMGPGMYGMPPAAAAGQRRDQAARGEDDTSLAVVLEDADAIPILTSDGVVYADGGG